MASQFTVYRSTDTSAPVLEGVVDSMRQLLKACLVDGYGSQTAAGWTEAFTGTNKAAFRADSGTRHYFRVQDDGGGTGGAKEALIRGFETMSDVDTGTGEFPTAAQSSLTSNSLVIRKSATADGTDRAWIVIADDRTCYVLVFTGDNATVYLTFGFGEFYSFVSGDAYNSFLIARATENSATLTVDTLDRVSTTMAVATGHYMPRGYTGLGTSVQFGKHGDVAKSNGATALLGAITFPNPADGGLYISRVWIHDNTTAPTPNIRGQMRGFWQPLHTLASFTNADTFSGVGNIAGYTFLLQKTSGNNGTYCFETSATLLEN